jgi:hypothetical protein
MTKKTYSRRKVIVSRWNTSQARMACACACRNSLHEGPARRGDGSMPAWLRSFPDGRSADLVAEAGELAVDASVAPRGVLRGQADDQGAHASGNRASTSSEGRGGPALGDGGAGWSSAGRRVGGASAGSSTAWRASRGGGEPVAAARGRRSRLGPSSSSAGVVCVVAARPAGGAGRGSRSPCWCRIGCAAPSRPGAWRTSGRSASAPPADHAGCAVSQDSAGQRV